MDTRSSKFMQLEILNERIRGMELHLEELESKFNCNNN